MKTIILYPRILRYLISLAIILGFMHFLINPANAQSKERTRLKAYYERLPDSHRKVYVVLTQGSGRSLAFVENAEIHISTFEGENEIDLTSIITDSNGEAYLLIESGYPFTKDDEGYYSINTRFDGNDSLRAADKLVKFKDLNIEISFKTEDSLKTVTLSTYEFDSVGNPLPIAELDLNVGVERLYSTLYLEKVETNEEGIASMIFPNDIPGDSIGTINVVVRLEEDDDYGTVMEVAKADWGIPVDYTIKDNGRSLFGDEAPLWMIISVFVILLGAWYHFIRAILKLYKMRNLGLNG